MTSHVASARVRRARHFGRLSDATAQRLAEAASAVEADEGGYLWRAGEPAKSFVIVERGLVLISVPRRDGEPAILGLFGPRECIGLAAALDNGRATYPADAVALSDSVQALVISAEQARLAAADDQACATVMREALLDHTRALRTKIEILSAGKVRARLASLLMHLADRFGDEVEGGDTFIPLTLSRAALAQLVSARPETVIRTLSTWRADGLVEATSDGFCLKSPARLSDIAEGA